jgi:hypothetical protein
LRTTSRFQTQILPVHSRTEFFKLILKTSTLMSMRYFIRNLQIAALAAGRATAGALAATKKRALWTNGSLVRKSSARRRLERRSLRRGGTARLACVERAEFPAPRSFRSRYEPAEAKGTERRTTKCSSLYDVCLKLNPCRRRRHDRLVSDGVRFCKGPLQDPSRDTD